jgi:SAM-dependent methyltransferase
MAIFTFKAPNGKRYTVSGSEGATQEEALDYLIANWDTLQDFPVTTDAEKEKVAEQPIETSIAQETKQPITKQPVAEQAEQPSLFDKQVGTDIENSPAYQSAKQVATALESSPIGAVRRYAYDQSMALSKGVIGVPEFITGIADIASGGETGKYLEDKGIDFKAAREYLTSQQSPEEQAAQKEIQSQDTFGGTLKAAVTNPVATLNTALESAPASYAGGAIGGAVKGIGMLGKASGVIGAGAGEFVVGAGQQAEGIRQETNNGLLTEKQSAAAVGAGAADAFLAGIGSVAAKKLGLSDIDTLSAGIPSSEVSLRDMAKQILGGMAIEGVVEEMPQSAVEKIIENYALDKPSLFEGVPNAAAIGLVTGATMGGGHALISELEKDKSQPEGTPIAESMLQGGLPTSEPAQPQAEEPVSDTLRAYTNIFRDENLNPTPPAQTVDTTAPIVDNETIAKDVINSNTLDDALQTFNNTVEANTYGHEVNMEYANKIADRFTGKKEIEIQDKDYQDSVQLENQLSTVRDELAYKKFQTAFEESNQQASKEEFNALVEQEIQDKNQQLKSVLDQQSTQKAQRFEASVPSTNTVIENEQWARTRNNRNAVIQMVFDRNLPAENIFPAIKAELKRQGFNDTQLSQDDIEAYTFLKEYPQANVQPSPQVIPTSVNEMDVESLIKEKPQAIQTEQLSPALSKVNEWVNNGATYKNGMLFDSKGKKFVLNKAQRKYYFMSRSSPLMQTPVAMGEGTVETRQGQDQISGVEEPNTPTAEMPTAETPTAEMPTVINLKDITKGDYVGEKNTKDAFNSVEAGDVLVAYDGYRIPIKSVEKDEDGNVINLIPYVEEGSYGAENLSHYDFMDLMYPAPFYEKKASGWGTIEKNTFVNPNPVSNAPVNYEETQNKRNEFSGNNLSIFAKYVINNDIKKALGEIENNTISKDDAMYIYNLAKSTGLLTSDTVKELSKVLIPTADYETRNSDRIARINQASTPEEIQSIYAEETSDNERHFEGTRKAEIAVKDKLNNLERESANKKEDEAYAAGEWVFHFPTNSLSDANQMAKSMEKIEPKNEYRVVPWQNDSYLVQKRKIEAIPTAEMPVTTYYNEPNGKYYGDVKEVTKIMPQELKPLSQTELNGAISSQKASGKSEEEWAKSVDLSEPIKATIYSDGEIKIQDGHHRYLAAKILNTPLNVELKSINAKNQILNDAINRINKDVSQATPVAETPVAETPVAEPKGTINNPILRKNGKAFTSPQGAQTHIRTNPELSKDTHTWVKLGEEKYGIVTEDQVVRKPRNPAANLNKVNGTEELKVLIGKLGGLDRTEMADRGFTDYKKNIRLFNNGARSRTFDDMATVLREDYGFSDINGANDLETVLWDSLNGKPYYGYEGIDNAIDKMAADRADQEKQKQDELLNTYTNEEVNAILDAQTQAEKDKIIADIKAEKKRKADLEVDTVVDEMLGKGMTTSGDLFAPERKGKATVGREVTIEGEQLANSPLELKKLYPNHWFYGDKGAQSKFDETEIDYETQYPNLESVSLINTDSNIGGFYDQVEQAIYQTSQSDRTTLHELGHAIHHQLLNYRKLTEDERATLKELILGDAEANHPYLASDKELVAEFNLYAHVFPVKAKAYAPELYKELVDGRKDVSIKLGSQDNKALTAALKQANVTIEKGYVEEETYTAEDSTKEISDYTKKEYVKQKLASNPKGDVEEITKQAEREHRAAIELRVAEGWGIYGANLEDYLDIWEKKDSLRKKYKEKEAKANYTSKLKESSLENRRNEFLEDINDPSDDKTYKDRFYKEIDSLAKYLGFEKFKNTGVFTIFKNSKDEYLVFNNPNNFLDDPTMVAFDKKGNTLLEGSLRDFAKALSINVFGENYNGFSENDLKQIAGKIKEVYGDLSKLNDIVFLYSKYSPKNINEFTYDHPRFGYDRTDIFKYEISKAIPNLIKPSSLKFSKAKSQQRLAPNGKPSNLNAVQYEQVRTPEFKEWFGDWENDPENASKVVDENGEPLVVYHGTISDFTEFSKKAQKQTKLLNDGVFYFSANPNLANKFAKNIKLDNKAFELWQNAIDDEDEDYANLMFEQAEENGYVIPVFLNAKFVISINKNNSQIRAYTESEGLDTKESIAIDKLKNGNTQGVIFNNALDADNVVSDLYVVSEPNQIKSATGNTGAFSKESNDIRFSKTAKKVLDENPLAIIHNLSLGNLAHADKMGGLAVPSVAIVNQKYPLSGFGEITLIGDTSQFAPEVNAKNKYFNADVYSPRYPINKITYVVDFKALNNANESLSDDTKELAKAIGNRGLINASSIEDSGVLKGLQDSVTLKYEFLKSIGKAPKMQYKPNKPIPPTMKKFVSSKIDAMELENDPAFVQAVVDIFNESIRVRNERLNQNRKYIAVDSQDALDLASAYQYNIKEFRDQKGAQKSIDDYATSKLIREKTNQAQYEKWLVENYSNLVSDERIFNGYTSSGKRVYLPHNLDTVVKLMTKTIRGGENVSYGIGTIRAYTAKQFKTVKQIQDARGDIVSDKKLAQLKEELESEFNSISDELRPYSDYSDPSATDALSDLVSKGLRAFKESYQDVPQETMTKVYSFLDKLKNMPAHYFEGKIGRAVDIGEFSGALVPKGKEYDEAVKILNANGITKIKRYTEGDAQSRSDALLNFSDLLFGKNRQPATNTHTEQSLKEGLTKAGDDAYGKGWTDRLFSTGMFEIISDEQAQAIIEESTGTKFALVGDRSAANTQIDTTMGAYAAVARNLFAKIPNLKNILDYGAGKGRGTASVFRALTNKGMDVNVKSYEPFPENWAKSLTDEPDFTNADNIKDGSQDAVVNLNVLNVVPRAIRDDIVKNIGRILKDGGVGVISSRRWKGDVDTIKPANSKAGEEPNSFYVTRKLKGVEQTNYQKGIEPDELVAYVQELLPDFDVRKINGYGASAVIIQKSGGTPILDSILKPVKKEKVEIGSAETEALRKEAKELGAGERYSEFGVGKKMGDEVYLHRDYEGVLPQGDLADAKERIDDFEYNLIRYNTKTGAIGFFNSPDFDTSPEPINGNLIVVEPDGAIRTVDLNKNPDKQAIYHHKWEWVKDDYKGFDVKQSIERSIAWQKVVNREGIDRKRIGFQGVWQNEVLQPFDIKYSKNGDIEAFYNPADGKTYFVAENIDKEKDLHYLMMHEVSVHMLKMGANEAEFENFLKETDNLVKVKNPAAVKGRQDALDADTPQEDLREETLAYLIKYAPKLKIVQRFKAWLKNALRNMSKMFPASQKLGFIQWANNLSDQDLLYIAEATLRKAPEMLVAQRQDTGNVKFSLAQNEENLFNLPAETKFQFIRKWVQDDLLRIRVVLDKIREQGGKVDESNDVVLAMEAAGNIAANQLENLKERFIQPLIDRMAKMNVNKDEIGLLLYAKGAPSRNAYIQSINPTFRKLGEGGSGMTDAQSAAIIERYKETMGDKYPEFEKLVDDWQNIQNIVKRILVQSGDISPEQAEEWDNASDYHVPMKGFEEVDEVTGKATKKSSRGNIGQGFSISGKFDRRALGRQSRANQIVENIVMNLERAVIRSSKMYTQSVLYKLIEDNPDANLWETEVTPMQPVMGKSKAQYVMYFHGSEIGQRDTLRDARRYVEAETARTGQSKREYEIIKVGGEPQVTLMKKPYDQNEEISYWRNGKQVRITVNDPEFVQAFNRLGDENIYSMFKVMGAFNRFLRHAYTILNPVFIIANGVMVDPAVALYTNTARKGFKYASTVLANTPMASLQLAKYMAKGTSGNAQWDNTIKSYLDNGGKSGTAFISSIEQKADELNLAVLKSKMMDTKFYEYPLDKLKLMVVDNKLANLMKYLGEVGETATRLSTFKVAVDKGMSPQEAAKVARNVTINFNRRGIVGRELGAMYLFLNASIQGTENLIDATIRGEHKAQATAILSTYVALGYLIALLGGDDGDDDLIPEEEKNRYVSIVLDKETGLRVNWKLAYGLSFFKDVGTAIHRIQAGGDVEKITNKLMSSFFGNFAYVNPMVSGEWDAKDLIAGMIPTFGRIPYSVINNRNQWGKPIYPEDVYNTTVPDSEKEWSTTRGTMYSDFAKWMNKVTGGTKVESGLVDISPETMKYLTNALTGSAGTQVYKFVNSIYTSSMNAEEMGLHNLPVVSGFVKENTIDSYRNVYNSQRKEAKDIYDKFKKYEKLGDDDATDKFTSKHQPTLDFYDETKSIIKEVKDLRDKQDEARVEGDKALVKELEAEEKQLLIEYSYQYNQRQ